MLAPITWRRVCWHLNRTPLARPIKILRRFLLGQEIAKRRAFLAELPDRPNLRKHSAQLLEHGYAVITDVIDRFRSEALSEAGGAKLLSARARVYGIRQEQTRKDFWVRLLDEDMQDGTLPLENPFVAIALQPEILSIVARAFGELPRLDYVLLTWSRHTGKEHSQSQLWHRDYDDTRVIKLFVYLTDVQDSNDGPFTFIPGPESDKVGYSLRSHQTDTEISRFISLEAVVEMTAPRLSAFLVETSRCLHMGSRVGPGRDRLLYTATFISVPRMFPEPPPRFRLKSDEAQIFRSLLLSE